jgi:RimJ/RimL family protein N-acetyltransferase
MFLHRQFMPLDFCKLSAHCNEKRRGALTMIYKLNHNDYNKVTPLLQHPNQHNKSTLNAIVNGMNRGNIYVDNIENPTTALIDVIGTISIFIGDATNKEFIRYLRDFIENKLRRDTYESCGGTYFITVINDKNWEGVLEEVISHRKYEPDFEQYYRFNREKFSRAKSTYRQVIDGYDIKKIDRELIEKDSDYILSEALGDFWYSMDDFLQYGFGYCVMKGDRVVSTCLSCCVHEQEHEISVATYEEEEMKKGFATMVCAAYLEHCIQYGLIPKWSTFKTNIESVRLAEKLGFEFVNKLKTLEFEY